MKNAEREKAESDLKAAKVELEKVNAELTEIQDRIDGNYSSNIEIHSEVTNLEDGSSALFVTVIAKNVGTHDIVMDLGKKPLIAYKLNYSRDRVLAEETFTPSFYQILSSDPKVSHSKFGSQYLSVGAIKNIPFFIQLEKPGVYLLVFQADVSKKVKGSLMETGKNPIWFASKYIVVPKTVEKEVRAKQRTQSTESP